MGTQIKLQDEVWTADEQKLGMAQALFHRTGDVDPQLQLYATYLEVSDFDYGETFFVPTDFIAERGAEAKRITVNKTRNQAMQLTWYRMPDFVAHGQYRKEALPE
jgi:hypothetical protein